MFAFVMDGTGSAFEAHLACLSYGFTHLIELFHPLFSGSNVHRCVLNQVRTLNRCRFNSIEY